MPSDSQQAFSSFPSRSLRGFPPSFTLLELLLVIGILSVLASVTFIALNPVETMRTGKDTQRLSDLDALNKAVNMAVIDNTALSLGTASTLYISLPDSSQTCGSWSLPTLPAGWTYHCAPTATLTNTDGTGWVPVNTKALSIGSPIPKDPLDPLNDSSHFYAYTPSPSQTTWELASVMESAKYKLGGQNDKTSTDGGQNLHLSERGTDLTLIPIDFGDSSLVGWWKFDESAWVNDCSTKTVIDSSGKNNGGQSCPNGTGPTTPVAGKRGNAVSLDGNVQYVNVPYAASLNINNAPLTMSAWIYPITASSSGGYGSIVYLGPGTGQRFLLNNSRYILFQPAGGISGATTPASSIALNQWTLVTTVADSSKLYIYLNGVFSVSASYSSQTDISNYVRIGRTDEPYPFNGYLDDIRIYNRALSASEVLAIYNATR